jgi:hypothetical protein
VPPKGSGTGIGLHEKGYPRYWRRGPLYSKLVHRVVMAAMCREFCYYPLGPDGIPPGFDVHHMDFNKLHWCHCNLLLIDHVLHYHADQPRRGYNLGVARAAGTNNGVTHFEEVED